MLVWRLVNANKELIRLEQIQRVSARKGNSWLKLDQF